MFGPLLIGGGITQANPDMLKDLLETFASSPLAQILKAKNGDKEEDDDDEITQEVEDLEDKTPVPEAKPTEELPSYKKVKEEFDKAKVIEKDPETGEERELSDKEIAEKNFEARQIKKRKGILVQNINMVKESLKKQLEKGGFGDVDIDKAAEEIVGGFDDSTLDPQEIESQVIDYLNINKNRTLNAVGGMIDKAISYGPRN
jgi:hypothetical protein